jgi:hypothetical protein
VAGGPAGGPGGGAMPMPVVAGGLASLRAILVLSPLVKTSASRNTMNTPAAIHPQGVGELILASSFRRRSISARVSKSRGSVVPVTPVC